MSINQHDHVQLASGKKTGLTSLSILARSVEVCICDILNESPGLQTHNNHSINATSTHLSLLNSQSSTRFVVLYSKILGYNTSHRSPCAYCLVNIISTIPLWLHCASVW